MDYATWKKDLVKEIETAAMRRTQEVFADANEEARAVDSQMELLRLAEYLRAMPETAEHMAALFREEGEIDRLERAPWGEAEQRYHDAKEDLLAAIGFEHVPFATADEFLDTVRARLDEIISEYRLLPSTVA